MKRKLWLILPATCLLLILAGLGWMRSRSLSFSTGRYLRMDNGVSMVIVEETPVVLSAESGDEIFSRLETGDQILLLHGGIRESYPAGTDVHAVWKLEDGASDDIPQSIWDRLEPLYPSASPDLTRTQPASLYDPRVAWVNWYDGSELWELAVNKESAGSTSLPVYRFTSVQDVERFRDTMGELLTLDRGYDEAESFLDITGDRDEEFFQAHSLLAVYITSGSGSDRFGAKCIRTEGNRLTVGVCSTNAPDIGTDDMAGWLVTVAVPNSTLESFEIIDAEFI